MARLGYYSSYCQGIRRLGIKWAHCEISEYIKSGVVGMEEGETVVQCASCGVQRGDRVSEWHQPGGTTPANYNL